MTLFVGGPWDGRDVPLTEEEQQLPYVVVAFDEATHTMYTPHRWVGPGRLMRTVFAVSWWGVPEVEQAVRHWLRKHPEEVLPW